MATTQGKLLIVDDEIGLIEILISFLRPFGFHIEVARDGKEAFDKILNGGIDAVLSDIFMPRMGGIKLLSSVRGMGLETPFIFLTSFGDKENVLQALHFGAFYFLEKPFDEKVVINVVKAAMELGKRLNAN